jgi:hypothetical protein
MCHLGHLIKVRLFVTVDGHLIGHFLLKLCLLHILDELGALPLSGCKDLSQRMPTDAHILHEQQTDVPSKGRTHMLQRPASAWPLLKLCVPYSKASTTPRACKSPLSRALAWPGLMSAHGQAPSGRNAKNLSHSVWTAQELTSPAQLLFRRIALLPAGLFLRLSSRRQTSSPSRQITEWALYPSAEVAVHFFIGNA